MVNLADIERACPGTTDVPQCAGQTSTPVAQPGQVVVEPPTTTALGKNGGLGNCDYFICIIEYSA